MTIAKSFNCMDAIDKDGSPKITGMKNLLGGSQKREVATIGSTVIVTQECFIVMMGEETT